jgi:hypothetical protein
MGIVYAVPPVNPPREALVANGGSAAASGIASGTSLTMIFLAWNVSSNEGFVGLSSRGVPLHHVGLAAALMFAATVLAGLALYFTALSRPACEESESKVAAARFQFEPMQTLKLYTSLTLLGLAADVLAPTLLLIGQTDGFRLAAIVGTLLQLAALAVGIRRHLQAKQ